MGKDKINLADDIMIVDTGKQTFDMQDIGNRHFMYNPQTGSLLLWNQYKGQELYYSDAERLEKAEIKEPVEQFVAGWVGTGRSYKNGVIHFAPAIGIQSAGRYGEGFDTLVMFQANNANGQTVVRGFGKLWEQPLSKVIEAGRHPPALEAEKKPSVRAKIKAGQPKQAGQPKKAARPDKER